MSSLPTTVTSPTEASEPVNYWGEARQTLDEKTIQNIDRVTNMFNKSTERAIDKLTDWTSDPDTKIALEKLKKKLPNLDIQQKGEIQRLARDRKKIHDPETKPSIQDITKFGEGNGPVDMSMDKLLSVCQLQKKFSEGKPWKFKLFQQEVDLPEVWARTIKIATKLKEVGALATSANPIATTVWSAAMVALQVSQPNLAHSSKSQI